MKYYYREDRKYDKMGISQSQYIPIYREDTIYIYTYIYISSLEYYFFYREDMIYTKCWNPKIRQDSIALFPQFRWLQKKEATEGKSIIIIILMIYPLSCRILW